METAARYAWLSHSAAYALMKELDGLLNMGSFGHAYFIHVERACSVEKTGPALRTKSAQYRSKVHGWMCKAT